MPIIGAISFRGRKARQMGLWLYGEGHRATVGLKVYRSRLWRMPICGQPVGIALVIGTVGVGALISSLLGI